MNEAADLHESMTSSMYDIVPKFTNFYKLFGENHEIHKLSRTLKNIGNSQTFTNRTNLEVLILKYFMKYLINFTPTNLFALEVSSIT